MFINKIELENFRNYEKQTINLNKEINIIYGNNAQGKTNIIESVFLCAYGKSFRSKKDKELIRFGSEEAIVNIDYERADREGKIRAVINDKKTFFINGIKQNKISEIVGKINVVIFTPDDIDIVKEGPDVRRKFLNMLISSLKPNYMYLLNNYNDVLEQRNNYLKQIKYENKKEDLLDIFDEQLIDFSDKIFAYREEYINKMKNRINVFHNLITKSGKEDIDIKYFSDFKEKEVFSKKLRDARFIDIQKGYTSVGIHRDDFKVYINGKDVSIYGSQGQQRTSVLSIKLTELDIVKEAILDTPILLLDDFMSELDEIRRTSFLENIKDCQVLLTCTDKINLERLSDVFYVDNGVCTIKS